MRQFNGIPGLWKEMTSADFSYFLRYLLRRKAARSDGVTYKMLASAPPNQQTIMLEGLNLLLAGEALQDDWKGGTVRLLSK